MFACTCTNKHNLHRLKGLFKSLHDWLTHSLSIISRNSSFFLALLLGLVQNIKKVLVCMTIT